MSSQIAWGTFSSVFIMVFLAELGDKTQLTALAYTAAGSSRVTVFLAASGALVLSTLLAVFLGKFVHTYIPKFWINISAGVLFICFGIIFVISALKKQDNSLNAQDKIINQTTQQNYINRDSKK